MKTIAITQEQIMEILEKCYSGAIEGVPGSKKCTDLAAEYLEKYEDQTIAIRKFVSNQIAKCSTSGFITSFGGIITLPFSVPANVASVIYIQLRMIATIAAIGGYDVKSDEVQTLSYVCLAGTSLTDICKSSGVQVANKITFNMVKKIPGSVLTKINQKVGFRLFTKFGEKGLINLGKMVPVVGAVVGGGFDYTTTKMIAKRAYKTFILNEID